MSVAENVFVKINVEVDEFLEAINVTACQFHNLAVRFLQLPEFDPDHPHRQELRQALREIGLELGEQGREA